MSALLEKPRELVLLMVVAFVGLGSSGTVRAEPHHDGGFWLMGLARGSFESVSPKVSQLRWWLEVQGRFSDDLNGYGQSIVRPGLGWAVSNDLSVWLGYGWIHDRPALGDDFNEHRIWQQVLWNHAFEHVGLQSRTRLEQRFVSSGDDLGVRFRQFVKLAYPFPVLQRLAVAGYGEIFLNFNDADWGANAGLDQTRAFLGLNWKFDEKGRVAGELGYLNRYSYRKNAGDRMDHLLSINIFLSY